MRQHYAFSCIANRGAVSDHFRPSPYPLFIHWTWFSSTELVPHPHPMELDPHSHLQNLTINIIYHAGPYLHAPNVFLILIQLNQSYLDPPHPHPSNFTKICILSLLKTQFKKYYFYAFQWQGFCLWTRCFVCWNDGVVVDSRCTLGQHLLIMPLRNWKETERFQTKAHW